MGFKNIDTKTFAPKDAKIIKDNPDKSAYDLLALGLSEKAFDRLNSNEFAAVDNATQRAAVEPLVADEIKSENANSDVLQPTSVEAQTPTNAAVDNATESAAVSNQDIVEIQHVGTGEILTTTKYFANLAVKSVTHKIVSNNG